MKTERRPARRPAERKLALLVAAALTAAPALAATAPESPAQALSRLPIAFEANEGQFRPDILFVARGIAGEVAVRYGNITISTPPRLERDGRKVTAVESGRSLRVGLAGSNPAPRIEAGERLASVSHHYQGEFRRENIANYGEVVMRDVYSHVDLALHGRQGALEYDFVLSPGAEPRDIRLKLDADKVELDAAGNLVMRVGSDTLTQHAPVAYQDVNGDRIPVDSRFELRQLASGAEAGFVVGDYDRSQPLVIDPMIGYSTYLGGSGQEWGGYLKVGGGPSVFIAYTTTTASSSLEMSTSSDVQVTKFSPLFTSVTYTTTLAGSNYDVVNALALGSSGGQDIPYITGYTRSTNFPTCFKASDCAAPGGLEDAFVTILNPNGTVWASRYLGGSGNEAGADIATLNGNVFVTGDTDDNFPTTAGAWRPNRIDASGTTISDAFATKLDGMLSLVYSTYIGGTSYDVGKAIALDPSGNAYLAGTTQSTDFPLRNEIDSTGPGMYVLGLNSAGSDILFSTYLGGSGTDDVAGLVRQPSTGDLMLLGDTTYPSYPLVNQIQGFAGGRDAYLARLHLSVGASGTMVPSIAFSTYLGGTGNEFAGGVAVGASGNNDYWVVGGTTSGNFPTVAPIQSMLRGGSDAFVSNVRNDTLVFSTFLGGSASEMANSVAMGGSGTAYVGGRTTSVDYPLVNPLDSTFAGNSELFITRFDPAGPSTVTRYDWNSDHKPDIIYRNTGSGATYVWRMNGTTLISDQYVTTIDPSWDLIGHGDFNGDGKNDMVWRNNATGAAYVWYMNNGAFMSDAFLFTIDPIWKVESVNDFNRDGKPDFLFRHQSTGVGFLWYWDNTTPLSDQYLYSIDNSWIVENTGDFNQDGYPDFLFRSLSSGLGFIWDWNGSSLGASRALFTIDPVWEVVEIADWNNDFRVDLLFRNASSGLVFVWYTDGTSLTGSDLLFTVDPSWKIVPYR